VQPTLHFPSHVGEDALEDYAFRRLSPDETAGLEEHLLICDDCQSALEDVDQYICLMQTATLCIRRERRQNIWKSLQGGSIPLREALRNVAAGGLLGVLILTMLVITWKPEKSAAAPVTLASFRGADSTLMAHAPARQPLDLAIDAVDIPATDGYRIEIVNAMGKPAWNGPLSSGGGKLTALVPIRLGAGIYWVRLYGSDMELLREFGLSLE
jgi:hypothetical protein